MVTHKLHHGEEIVSPWWNEYKIRI